MNCPFCHAPDTRVINSRPSSNGEAIRRRRECQECTRRFTTFEYVEKVELMVIKRNGTREPFQSSKILSGIAKACEKRPVSAARIDRMVQEVEVELLATSDREIRGEEIGRLVLKHLKEVDPVAYLRFASVYKQFQDLQDFSAELRSLMKD